jgi:MFS transporter, MHS family, shikimate and dehydroshikimate transport protein
MTSDRAALRRTTISSLIGTTIETYDFFAYGTAAALVFGSLFFPKSDPLVGTLLAFATFGAGFVARPLGSILFGHLGDRVGRKPTLVLTLLLMGASTMAIGLLPTYAMVGVWAPILLVTLRILQGLSFGGELGGAALIVVEHAPREQRGRYGSWAWVGTPAGLILSTLLFIIVGRLPDEQFEAWGWRIPFLLSIVLIAVGVVIRRRLAESPTFTAARDAHPAVRAPMASLLTRPRGLLTVIGAKLGETVTFYAVTVFALSYASTVGVNRTSLLYAVLVAALVEAVAIPVFGALSDRVGRRPVSIAGAGFILLFIVPFFLLMESGSILLASLGTVLMLGVGHAAIFGPQTAFFSELFDPRVRYTGFSVGVAVASVIGGGFAPFVATALLDSFDGSFWPVAAYIGGLAAISLVTLVVARETRGTDVVASPAQAPGSHPDADPAPAGSTPPRTTPPRTPHR